MIVLVATIGVAELCQAVVRTLPDYRTGELQTAYPSPMTSQWTITSFGVGPFHVHDITITGPQLLAIIVVPIITLGLWWLLGHTRFGEAVRATATNADLARLTGISPKLMSTAIWTIAGFLSAVSVILYATAAGLGRARVDRARDAAARPHRRAHRRHDVVPDARSPARSCVGLLYQVLVVQLPERRPGSCSSCCSSSCSCSSRGCSRADDAGGESFSFAPRVPPVPERLREIWWVRRMPQLARRLRARSSRSSLPLVVHAVGAPSHLLDHPRVRDLRGLGDRAHRLGRSALARADGVRRHRRAERRRVRARRHGQHRLALAPARSTARSSPFPFVMIARARSSSRSSSRSRRGGERLAVDAAARSRSAAIVVALGLAAVVRRARRSADGAEPLPFVLDVLLGALVACLARGRSSAPARCA